MLNDHKASSEPIWPYIGVVSCLFILSVFAARSWHTDSQPAMSVGRTPAIKRQPPAPRPTANFATDSWVEPGGGFAGRTFTPPVLRNRDLVSPLVEAEWNQLGQPAATVPAAGRVEHSPSDLVQTRPASGPSLVGPTVDLEVLADELPLDELPLADARSVAPQEAALAPPVADRISLDPEAVGAIEQPAAVIPKPVQPTPVPVREVAEEPAVPHEISSDWPVTPAIDDLLEALNTEPHCSRWVNQVLAAFAKIRQQEDLASSAAGDILLRLRELSMQGRSLASTTNSHPLRSQLLRVSYAVERRRILWEQVHQITADANHGLVAVGLHDLEDAIDKVDKHLGSSSVADGWRDYLRLSELRDANQFGDGTTQRTLARRTLERMSRNDTFSEDQRSYLAKPPFTYLVHGLSRWAREPIDYTRLLRVVEQYESRGTTANATELARVCQVARWSDHGEVSELAKTLETHYRNANLRVAVNVDLINRLLPQPQAVNEKVEEYVLGAYVNGNSETNSRLNVVLEPDERLWRLRLEAKGSVASHTAATKGPATFYNDGYSEFEARKTLLVDDRGVKVEMAEADAATESELTGFETQFDPVPVVGLLARVIARQQHDERYGDARAATEALLEERARERLDEEVHERLREIETDFRTRIIMPFTALDLRPKAIDMHTTDNRLVIRYRLAGENQLGAHTARPQAPSDSLLSVQVHETMLNNIISQLNLEGSRDDLRSLYSRIGGRFQRELEVPEDLPEGVFIRFAKRDALRVRFEDGRVVLTARIAELASQRHVWRNFAVRVYYVPAPSQQDTNLTRDGIVELAGSRLRLGDQIALRGIFAKVFSKNSPVNVINRRLASHPQMNDLQVTQFVISDGWIGVALAAPPESTNVPSVVRRRILRSRR